MAKNILNELTAELATLENELKDFKTAVGYLKEAKVNVQSAVDAVNKAESYHLDNLSSIEKAYARLNMVIETVDSLSVKIEKVDFPTRLTSIEENLRQVVKSIDETTKSTLIQLKEASESIAKADFDNKFKKLDNVVNTSISEAKNAVNDTQKLSAVQSEKLEDQINRLEEFVQRNGKEQISFFTSLNLESKFQKLDTSVVSTVASVQNIQGRVDLVERSIKDKLTEMQQQSRLSIDKGFAEIKDEIHKEKSKAKLRFYFTSALMIIAIIVFSILKYIK